MTYTYYTVWNNFPSVPLPGPRLLSSDIFGVSPQSQVFEQSPELPVQPMPFVCIGRVGTAPPSEEVWWAVDYTWAAQAVLALIATLKDWDMWRVPVAFGVVWKHVACTSPYMKKKCVNYIMVIILVL